MTSWSLIEDGHLTLQVPVVRQQVPYPLVPSIPSIGWLALFAQETGFPGFIPSRNQ